MFRVIVAIALSTLLFGCQIEARIASDAETAYLSAAPEYMNPNPRAPYSEGVLLKPIPSRTR